MDATASSLRDLHLLHQRAKAIRDRLLSAPKTLAARQATFSTRQAALDAARKALQDLKIKIKGRETQVQSIQSKIDDLKVKLNAVKKNDEYRILVNQIAHDKAAITKIEDEVLESMGQVEVQALEVTKIEGEAQAFAAEVAAMKADIDAQAEEQKRKLAELEAAIAEAEVVIPDEERDRYRRTVKQRGADALAHVESGACSSCWVSVTPQAMNELINHSALIFCKTCGCILYLADEDVPNTRRSTSTGR